MKRSFRFGKVLAAMAVAMAAVLSEGSARAHCDTLDGPVISLARQALDKKDVKIVLPWVAPEKEAEIRKAFDLAVAVRGNGAKEKELADTYFFETLVRVHRDGEGAPYTGLKPAGLDLGPAIPAADKALETGDPTALLALVNEAVHAGIHKQFTSARERKAHAAESVEAGRAYVAAYVPYVHFVERLYGAATTPIAHGAGEGGHAAGGHPEPEGHAESKHAH
ncbi:MAG TPA: DUF6448 family protein [Candidatus Deferrimicrobiaceae bacterium]